MVFEAKVMLPWSFSEEAAAEKFIPQLQHNMWMAAARQAVLSVISGGGKWVEITANADPLYQHLIVTAERKFWRCVERPGSCRGGIEPPKPRIAPHRLWSSCSWCRGPGEPNLRPSQPSQGWARRHALPAAARLTKEAGARN